MKILFVTSSLAPGKDGVGDHVRALARECIRRGHQCRLLALHDGYVYGARYEEDAIFGRLLRMGRNLPWAERIRTARHFVSSYDPGWVSVQMVPYGYHAKGLPWRLADDLRRLCAGFPVHLMFHELWIGAEQGASLRARIIGGLQRVLWRRVVARLRPAVVQTSNETYVELLEREGIPATRLPMFGAVAIEPDARNDWFVAQLQQAGLPVSAATRSNYWIVGLFGALHPVWPPEPLLSRLHDAALDNHKQLVLVSAGRLGAGEALWNQIVDTYGSRFRCWRMGEQAPANLSQLLRSLDFGIATTPWALLGKSATAAAMLEHGLPVIVNRHEVSYRGVPAAVNDHDPLLIKLGPGFEAQMLRVKKAPPLERVSHAADIFEKVLAMPDERLTDTPRARCPHPFPATAS